ncbi:SRPBCC domain-containing protein [Arthrobacter sp. PAMC25564]|uniref:SRPBCC family protein n=1 Tax=Arthrobacter sp. PAMC25564 TaxID=2565366 RepID=UPI0010A2984A|nr:SRPBCC domain-containing protein [Arthrobacter sp. PAMC25564]QCB96355.1 SRPBCC domain-containing protein [Arthrobacter sp. PAMC25564]
MSEESAAGDDLMLVIVREFRAPIAVVWSALTDPDQAPDWWGPHGFHVPRESIDTDLEVGGLYRACMIKDDTGEEHWWSGVHTDIEPPGLLMFTHAWDKPDGTRGFETEVAFRLEEVDGGSLMTFTQGPFESVESRDAHGSGWLESFERLANHLGVDA